MENSDCSMTRQNMKKKYLKLLKEYKEYKDGEGFGSFTEHINYKKHRKIVDKVSDNIPFNFDVTAKESRKILYILGFYNLLLSIIKYIPHLFPAELIQCILATEQYDIYYNLVRYYPVKYQFTFKELKMVTIYLVEAKQHKVSEKLRYLYDFHTVTLFHFLNNKLATINDENMNHYSVYFYSFYYGYLQTFCTDMAVKINTKLKPLTVQHEGIRRMRGSVDFIQTEQCHINDDYETPQNSDVDSYPFTVYMKSKMYVKEGDIEMAIHEYMWCFIENSDCLIRALALRDLSEICRKNKRYLMSLKTLRYCYKLCKGYILPSFVNKQYKIKKKIIKSLWKKQTCAQCGKKSVKMKCCSGCLFMVYCGVLCQKQHWKCHRQQCFKYRHHRTYNNFRDRLKKALL